MGHPPDEFDHRFASRVALYLTGTCPRERSASGYHCGGLRHARLAAVGETITDVSQTYAWQVISWTDRLRGRYADTDYTRRLLTGTAIRLVEQQFKALANLCPDARWELMTGLLDSPCCEPAELLRKATEAAWKDVDRLEILAAQAVRSVQVNRETSRSPCSQVDTALTRAYAAAYGYLHNRRQEQPLRKARPALRAPVSRRPHFNVNRPTTRKATKMGGRKRLHYYR